VSPHWTSREHRSQSICGQQFSSVVEWRRKCCGSIIFRNGVTNGEEDAVELSVYEKEERKGFNFLLYDWAAPGWKEGLKLFTYETINFLLSAGIYCGRRSENETKFRRSISQSSHSTIFTVRGFSFSWHKRMDDQTFSFLTSRVSDACLSFSVSVMDRI
jgi:hypothetical protein